MTIDVLHDRVGSIVERACTAVCKFPEQYKDPDDCIKKHCDFCPLFEMAEDLITEIEEEPDEWQL